jgi:hypothetical protein
MLVALAICAAIVPCILLAGATVLWVKTKRVAALLQLIASVALFASCGAEGFAMLLASIDPAILD